MKWLQLDGAMLGFDRRTGRNVLLRGEETAHCVQKAPRVVQMAMTNACNKTCGFCYRPLEAKSRWDYSSILGFASFLDRWGVLELALGGGEPTVFPRFPQLVRQLWEETSLAINFTTNGTRLTDDVLVELAGFVGQIQVSVYDDEDLDALIERLVKHDMRFGLNYLVTPHRLKKLDLDILRWAGMGVRDVLLLSYKGSDPYLHLDDQELRDLDARIVRLYRHDYLRQRLQLKVDVCWSTRLPNAPQLFFDEDCRAGSLFMSITSNREVVSCSFAGGGTRFETFEELPTIYETLKRARLAAPVRGCARLPQFGAVDDSANHPQLVKLSSKTRTPYAEAR